MERIEYYVQVPNLSGMTEQERARATETYMRESQRQLRIILDQIEKELNDNGVDETETVD